MVEVSAVPAEVISATTAKAAAPKSPTPTTAAAPTVSQSVTVDWGSWVTQALTHEEPILEAAASAGLSLALAQIPFGAFVSAFVGPTVVKQYVDQAVSALSGVIGADALTVPAGGIEGVVANLINANEPALAAFLGANLQPLISAALARLGVKV
jgi:hypothetical protein